MRESKRGREGECGLQRRGRDQGDHTKGSGEFMEIFFPFFLPSIGKGTVTRRVSPISRGTTTYYWLHFVPETIVLSLFTISPMPPAS